MAISFAEGSNDVEDSVTCDPFNSRSLSYPAGSGLSASTRVRSAAAAASGASTLCDAAA